MMKNCHNRRGLFLDKINMIESFKSCLKIRENLRNLRVKPLQIKRHKTNITESLAIA